MFEVKVRSSPYWRVERGTACVGEAGDWTTVRADRPGIVKVSMRFSASAAGARGAEAGTAAADGDARFHNTARPR